MKSKVFYRELLTGVASLFKASGFKKEKGNVPLWSISIDDQVLYVIVKTGKYPWLAHDGGEFSIYAYLRSPKQVKPSWGDDDSLCVFLYANDAIKESILLQNKNVFEKIKNLEITTLEESIEDPAWGEILIELHSDAIEDISRDIENSY